MGQISAKYFFKQYRQKIFAASFKSYIQLVLKISFTSFLQPAWIETDSIVNTFSAIREVVKKKIDLLKSQHMYADFSA